MRILWVFFLISGLTFKAFSADAAAAPDAPLCVNGASEKNLKLLNSFEASKDPLKMAFLAQKSHKPAPAETPELPCVSEEITKKQLNDFKAIAKTAKAKSKPQKNPTDNAIDFEDMNKSSAQLPAMIKRECIAASMKRNPGQTGYTCSSGKKGGEQTAETSYGQVGGKTQQCITDDMVDYVQFAVNRAIKCLSPDKPIDSRVIYQKFNNETGFNYSIAWNGGVGIGQLTTPAIKELSTDLGSGQYILENVTKSNKESCQAFKNIAASDLKSYPRVNSGNYCDFVSAGDGLARNLLYGIGYYIHMRDNYITPALSSRAPQFMNDREVVSALTAISYGAEGINKAKALIAEANKKTKRDDFLKTIRKKSAYLTAIKGKMREMYCLKDNVDPSSDDCKNKKLTDKQLGADQCVTQP